MSAVRLVEARQLVIQAEILCVERRDEDAGKGVRGLKPLFGSLERILEACVAFAGHHGTNTTEYTTSDLELFRDRSRELLESVDIFDGVFAIPDAGGDEQSAAVRQLLRRVRELGELFGATLTVRSSHLDSVRNALGQYARRLERVAEELAEQGSPSAVSRAVWIESVRLFVDWFASFEDIVDKVPQAHREIDSVLELIGKENWEPLDLAVDQLCSQFLPLQFNRSAQVNQTNYPTSYHSAPYFLLSVLVSMTSTRLSSAPRASPQTSPVLNLNWTPSLPSSTRANRKRSRLWNPNLHTRKPKPSDYRAK